MDKKSLTIIIILIIGIAIMIPTTIHTTNLKKNQKLEIENSYKEQFKYNTLNIVNTFDKLYVDKFVLNELSTSDDFNDQKIHTLSNGSHYLCMDIKDIINKMTNNKINYDEYQGYFQIWMDTSGEQKEYIKITNDKYYYDDSLDNIKNTLPNSGTLVIGNICS